MKTVLITGANKGIGFEIARQLLRRQFRVIVSGRKEELVINAVNELKITSDTVIPLIMDVSQEDSVQQAAILLKQQSIRLDVIINNAAILLKQDSSLIKNDETVLQQTLNTNCYGALRVIKTFLPLLNLQGRVINISSGGGSMTDAVGGWSPAYCVSKTLLNALTRQLASELTGRIFVNAVCPGWVKTDMGGATAPRTVEKGAETPVWLASEELSVSGKFFRDKKEIPW